MSLLLSPEELRMECSEAQLEGITHKVRPTAQVRALIFMGIEHKVRSDGTVLVLRAHVEHLLNPGGVTKVRKEKEPNWEAIT